MNGNYINAHILGVPVNGFWTGRGIRVEQIIDGKPLDTWMSLSDRPHHGRIALNPDGMSVVIELNGEYVTDEQKEKEEAKA